MDLPQLRMFVAVAEERHFRRAAARCYIAQPALSRRIQRLEQELGVALFHRTKRDVELTEAGRRFLETARDALARIDAGANELRRLSDADDTLRVGGVEFANFPFLPPALRLLRQRCPRARVVRRDLDAPRQVAALLGGEIDVGFFARRLEHPDLAYEPVMPVVWRVALPEGHRLAARSVVAIQDLDGAPLVLFARAANPGLHDWIRQRFAEEGATPEIVHEPAQLHSALGLVAAGFGVFPTPFFLEDHRQSGIVVRALAGFDSGLWVRAVFRRSDESVLLGTFLDAVRQAVGSPAPR